jgi:co-chaperonin GroES (HSP10)
MVTKSKYEADFKRLRDSGKKLIVLRGNVILIEIFEQEEIKSKGGIVLAKYDGQRMQASDFKAHMGIVLAIGEGYYDEDTGVATVPLDIQPGMIVMVPQIDVQYLSTFPGLKDYTQNKLALTLESNVKVYSPSVDAFLEAEAILGHAD